jgi:hypothetical protein
VVSKALDMLVRRREATAAYLDNRGVRFRVADAFVEAGFRDICKVYRHVQAPDGEAEA